MNFIREIETKWKTNFINSELVVDGIYQPNIARGVFYGSAETETKYPNNFIAFYNNSNKDDETKIEITLDILLDYLYFIGISISRETLLLYIDGDLSNLHKILNKAYYILKTLAHYDSNLDINDPYYDNLGDLFFLSSIETSISAKNKQLSLFEERELPELYNRYINLPEGYENNNEALDLFIEIEESNDSFFITGKAGTGKSTFIQYFLKNTEKQVLITAFTGIAAINVGGVTIHSFFRFPLRPLMPNDEEIPIFRQFYQIRNIIESMDTLVIDEVSMLRADLLEALDYSLRKNGGNPNKLFGGKQIILVGDIFQLPPVVRCDDPVENYLFDHIFNSEYFFDSMSYKVLKPKVKILETVFRQKDLKFIEILDNIRLNKDVNFTLSAFNERFNPVYIQDKNEFSIMLTANNLMANIENNRRLFEIQHQEYQFEANVTGEFKADRYPTDKTLRLKKNTQIILIRNDPSRRWVNGTIAKIDFVSADGIEIRLQNGSRHNLEQVTWENQKYQWDSKKQKIISKVIGTFEQFPIKLAWAITIHKSQGLTFDKVIIDMGTGAFVNGQIYTALSRCRTLDGIVLRSKLKSTDLIEDKRLIDFYKEIQNPN